MCWLRWVKNQILERKNQRNTCRDFSARENFPFPTDTVFIMINQNEWIPNMGVTVFVISLAATNY